MPGSTGQFLVRGQLKRIYVSQHETTWKEDEVCSLERFPNSREYEKKVVDPFGGRIKIERVCKDGWMMVPESGFGESGVFVPLTAKVAKMGIPGSVFSGMRLGLAGGVWRPLPASESSDYNICYNVYPPDFCDFEGSVELKKKSTQRVMKRRIRPQKRRRSVKIPTSQRQSYHHQSIIR